LLHIFESFVKAGVSKDCRDKSLHTKSAGADLYWFTVSGLKRSICCANEWAAVSIKNAATIIFFMSLNNKKPPGIFSEGCTIFLLWD
jgi:hypothetical protein